MRNFFKDTSTLAPSEDCDHIIPLKPDTKYYCIRPYRVSYKQKEEVEKLIKAKLSIDYKDINSQTVNRGSTGWIIRSQVFTKLILEVGIIVSEWVLSADSKFRSKIGCRCIDVDASSPQRMMLPAIRLHLPHELLASLGSVDKPFPCLARAKEFRKQNSY